MFFFVFHYFVAFLLRFACLFSLILVYCRARGSSTTIATARGVRRRRIRELQPCNGCHKGLHLVVFLILLFEFLVRLVVNNFVLLFLADRVRRNKGMHYLSFVVVDEAKLKSYSGIQRCPMMMSEGHRGLQQVARLSRYF